MARPTHDPAIDTLKLELLIGPAAVLALIFNYKFTFVEILWAFSIYLEAVAILPQLFMLQRTGEAETITTHYLAALGAYRGLYIPNWIYRYVAEYEKRYLLVPLMSPPSDTSPKELSIQLLSLPVLCRLGCILTSSISISQSRLLVNTSFNVLLTRYL